MAWDVVYYKAPDGSVPAIDFLDGCPTKVAANLLAVLDAVAEAPPPRYSGGGKWEAMHGTMGGYNEVRASGPGREQFHLPPPAHLCEVDRDDPSASEGRGFESLHPLPLNARIDRSGLSQPGLSRAVPHRVLRRSPQPASCRAPRRTAAAGCGCRQVRSSRSPGPRSRPASG